MCIGYHISDFSTVLPKLGDHNCKSNYMILRKCHSISSQILELSGDRHSCTYLKQTHSSEAISGVIHLNLEQEGIIKKKKLGQNFLEEFHGL